MILKISAIGISNHQQANVPKLNRNMKKDTVILSILENFAFLEIVVSCKLCTVYMSETCVLFHRINAKKINLVQRQGHTCTLHDYMQKQNSDICFCWFIGDIQQVHETMQHGYPPWGRYMIMYKICMRMNQAACLEART